MMDKVQKLNNSKLEMLTHFSCLVLESKQASRQARVGQGNTFLYLEISCCSSRFRLLFYLKAFSGVLLQAKYFLEICKLKVSTSITVSKSGRISDFLTEKHSSFEKV
jgi:hypothetical protein